MISFKFYSVYDCKLHRAETMLLSYILHTQMNVWDIWSSDSIFEFIKYWSIRMKNIHLGEVAQIVMDWIWKHKKSSEMIKHVEDTIDDWERQWVKETREATGLAMKKTSSVLDTLNLKWWQIPTGDFHSYLVHIENLSLKAVAELEKKCKLITTINNYFELITLIATIWCRLSTKGLIYASKFNILFYY